MARYKLKLKRLDWISPVDQPAQETARVLLIKRKTLKGFARAVKIDEGLGLVFCWAFTSKVNGDDYYDLQNDTVDEDFVKAAAEFMERGGGTDEMHDGESDGRVVFAMPMTGEIASAFGITTKTTGLMVALKPSAEVLAKFKSGEYTGVSIEGVGERQKVAAVARKDDDGDDDGGGDDTYKCADCGSYMKAGVEACSKCGGKPMPMKRAPITFKDETGGAYHDRADDEPIVCIALGKRAVVPYDAELRDRICKSTWSTATIDDLPDSSFLYIEPGGKKDDQGKTTPRSLRHFPYKDENGKIDLPHLRDAIGRIPQSSLPATLRNKLQAKAEKLLGKQHGDSKRAGAVAKHAYLTTEDMGHTHLLDHNNGQAAGYTDYAYVTGSTDGYHCHPWTRNSDLDTFVVGASAGHTHQVITQDQIDALVSTGAADADGSDVVGGDVDGNVADAADVVDAALDGFVPAGAGGKRNSTPRRAVPHGGLTTEKSKMPDAKDTEIADLKKKLEKRDAKIERLEKKYDLTDAQRAHFKTLDSDEAKDAFLAKSNSERDADVARSVEANPIIVSIDGVDYRKNDDPRLIAMAKRSKEQAEKLAAAETVAKRERLTAVAKTEFKHCGATAAVVKQLEWIESLPDAEKAEQMKLLKSHEKAMSEAGSFVGVNVGTDGAPDGENPTEKFQVELAKFAKSKNKNPAAAFEEFVGTTEGNELYQATKQPTN